MFSIDLCRGKSLVINSSSQNKAGEAWLLGMHTTAAQGGCILLCSRQSTQDAHRPGLGSDWEVTTPAGWGWAGSHRYLFLPDLPFCSEG